MGPKYSVIDLAELLGIKYSVLKTRVHACKEQPRASSTKLVATRFGKQESKMYDRQEFLSWHKRNYGHLEND